MGYFMIGVCMSVINLMIFLSVKLLDKLHATPKDKIKLIKAGLLLLIFIPPLVICCQLANWKLSIIIVTNQFMAQHVVQSVHARSAANTIDWSFYLFSAYIVGLALMLFRIILSYVNARKLLSQSAYTALHGHTVYLTDRIQSPLSFGFLNPNIYFPIHAINTWNERDIQIALVHESIHVERHDCRWKLISLFVRAFLYFVPWAFYLQRRFEVEMELACDQETCVRASAGSNEYGNLLLRLVSLSQENLVFSNLCNSTLRRRLIAMQATTITRPLLTTTLAAVLLLSGSMTTALASSITEKKCTYDVTTKIFVDGALVSSPHIIALEKEKAAIFINNKDNSQSLSMEFSGKDSVNDSIAMKFDVKLKNGDEQTHVKPEFVLNPGQEGRIDLSSTSGHSYQMMVVVKRV